MIEEESYQPAPRRMRMADVGTLLTNPIRRQLLIMCSVVPDFTADDLIESVDKPPGTVEEALRALVTVGAVHRVVAPPPAIRYTVHEGVRKVILAVVRGGFDDSTSRRPLG